MPTAIEYGAVAAPISTLIIAALGNVHIAAPRTDSNGVTYFTTDGKPPTNGSTVYVVKNGVAEKAIWMGRVMA